MSFIPFMPFTLRTWSPATDDNGALLSLINRAYEVEKFFVEGDRASADDLARLMVRGRFLVAEEAGTLVACVYVEERRESLYFGLLAVEPHCQGQGWGRRMVEAAEDHARAAGLLRVELRVVNLRTELPPFYRQLGYVETGTEPLVDLRVLKPCHFIVMSKRLSAPA